MDRLSNVKLKIDKDKLSTVKLTTPRLKVKDA